MAGIGSEVLGLKHESNWTIVVKFLHYFPDIAEDLNCSVETVFDEFDRRGLTKAAITLGKQHKSLNSQLGRLFRKMQSESIKVAAESEGKEIAAVQMCNRQHWLQPRLVQKLLQVGKLELARQWILDWHLGLEPTKANLHKAKRRAKKFFQWLC